jgi:hypothetical protein
MVFDLVKRDIQGFDAGFGAEATAFGFELASPPLSLKTVAERT